VVLMPGEDEMGSLAYNALGALRGDLKLQVYQPE
jgi:butyrate kinase